MAHGKVKTYRVITMLFSRQAGIFAKRVTTKQWVLRKAGSATCRKQPCPDRTRLPTLRMNMQRDDIRSAKWLASLVWCGGRSLIISLQTRNSTLKQLIYTCRYYSNGIFWVDTAVFVSMSGDMKSYINKQSQMVRKRNYHSDKQYLFCTKVLEQSDD